MEPTSSESSGNSGLKTGLIIAGFLAVAAVSVAAVIHFTNQQAPLATPPPGPVYVPPTAIHESGGQAIQQAPPPSLGKNFGLSNFCCI